MAQLKLGNVCQTKRTPSEEAFAPHHQVRLKTWTHSQRPSLRSVYTPHPHLANEGTPIICTSYI